MAFFFNKNKLDLSTPSEFGQSLRKNSDDLEKLFDHSVWVGISKKSDPRAYMVEVEDFARSGNLKCQELVVQWCIMLGKDEKSPERNKFRLRKAVEFGTMAAEMGMTREAMNLTISLAKLSHILIEENGGFFTDEIEYLSREMYRWSLRNSKNMSIPRNEREQAGKVARGLFESMPELYDDISS